MPMASGRFRSRIRAVLTSAAILLPALAVSVSASPTATAASSRLIPSSGVISIGASGGSNSNAGVENPEFPGTFGSDAPAAPGARPSTPPTGPAVTRPPPPPAGGGGRDPTRPAGSARTPRPSNPQLKTSFEGLNHFINRFGVNNGNQFSLEPPDQGLCAGRGKVFETVNDVLAIYNPDGTYAAGPSSQTEF